MGKTRIIHAKFLHDVARHKLLQLANVSPSKTGSVRNEVVPTTKVNSLGGLRFTVYEHSGPLAVNYHHRQSESLYCRSSSGFRATMLFGRRTSLLITSRQRMDNIKRQRRSWRGRNEWPTTE